MTKIEVIEKSCKILKENGVRYRIVKNLNGGWAYPKDNLVMLGITKDFTRNDIASLVIHELSHVLLYRQRKFFTYHNVGAKTRVTVKDAKIVVKIGLRAERYTDKFAKKLMKKHFPDLKYVDGYKDEEDVEWYHDVALKPLKELIERNS